MMCAFFRLTFVRLAWLLVIGFFLPACSLTPTVEVDAALLKRWQAHQAQLQQLSHWQLRASLVANSQDDGWSARVHWQQRGEAYQLRLQGPLGQGAIRLQGDAQGVSLYTGEQTYHADTPEALLKQAAHIHLPLRHLLFWVRGLPVPELHTQAREFTPAGQLARLQQDDWRIELGRYTRVDDYWLPQKIRLENPHYLAKLGITQWQLKP